MENYIIYTHFSGIEKIIELLKPAFPKSTPKLKEQDGYTTFFLQRQKGFFGVKEVLGINYRERTNPSFHLRNGDCPVTRQLRGMHGYVSSLPIQDLELRERFLRKIETINAEIVFRPDPKLEPTMSQLLRDITTKLHAFVFLQPGQSLSLSSVQHFLDEDLSLITDIEGNTGDAAVKVEIEARFFDDQAAPTTAQNDRKHHTEQLLQQHQIKINKHLPVTPDASAVTIRNKEDILERALCLALLAARGEGVEAETIERQRERLAIKGFTPEEETLMALDQPTDRDRAIMTWRYESLNLLFWSLNLTKELAFPTTICNVEELVAIIIDNDRPQLEQKAQLRPTEEILEQLDQTYRMHWSCVDARINGRQPDAGLSASVIYERHFALNWLISYLDQDWDAVTTDT